MEIMKNTKKSKIAKVHPDFIVALDNFRTDFRDKNGFDIPRTKASKFAAEVFDQMVKVNGVPRIGKSKKKNLLVTWEMKL